MLEISAESREAGWVRLPLPAAESPTAIHAQLAIYYEVVAVYVQAFTVPVGGPPRRGGPTAQLVYRLSTPGHGQYLPVVASGKFRPVTGQTKGPVDPTRGRARHPGRVSKAAVWCYLPGATEVPAVASLTSDQPLIGPWASSGWSYSSFQFHQLYGGVCG